MPQSGLGPRGQYLLGSMYGSGQGVPQDYSAAVSWYRKAAEQGDVDAKFELGLMYSNGQGAPQDNAAAVSWYRQAAEQGHATAQFNLGLMYSNGQGVLQDYTQAHMWLNLAAANVSKEERDVAISNRDRVAAKMTPSQIAQAQKLAREWKPKPEQ